MGLLIHGSTIALLYVCKQNRSMKGFINVSKNREKVAQANNKPTC